MSELSPRKISNLKVTAHLHCLVIAEKEERTVRNLSLVMRSNFKAPEISLGIFKEQYNFGCTIEGMKQDILKNSVRYENRMLTYLLRKQRKNTLNVGESSKVEQSLTYFFFSCQLPRSLCKYSSDFSEKHCVEVPAPFICCM